MNPLGRPTIIYNDLVYKSNSYNEESQSSDSGYDDEMYSLEKEDSSKTEGHEGLFSLEEEEENTQVKQKVTRHESRYGWPSTHFGD